MDLNKTGLFISALRKQNGLTQKELAEKIGVTDKAVSRWETGKGFPDVSNIKSLAEVLNVSITEIVNGERTTPENIEEKSDNAIIEAFNYSKQMSKKTIGVLLLIAGLGLIVYPLISTGIRGFSIFIFLGIVVAITAIVILSYRKPAIKDGRKTMRLSRYLSGIISLIAMTATLILEMLPSGAVLIFASGPDERIKQTFSYFSLTPFGYANFFPLLTALLTVVVTILTTIVIIKRVNVTRLQNTVFICTVIALIFSIIPILMFGTGYMSVVGIFITILLLVSLIFQALSNRK